MFLTPQIIKRLSISVGFKKSIMAKSGIEFIKEHVHAYIDKIIHDLVRLVVYSEKNTIKEQDINILYHISGEFHNVLAPVGLKNNFKYSHTKPFSQYIKSLIKKYSESEMRLSPDALIILLEIVELYLLELFRKTRYLFNRSSLLEKDLKLVIQI